MTTEATPEVKPPANRKLLIIIGAAIVALLAIIAIAVSSQAIRANEEAAAEASTVPEASKMAAVAAAGEKALADQCAEDAKDANYVCEQRLLKYTRPPSSGPARRSTYKASDGSFDTRGAYTDAPKGNPLPMQFVCSSIKGSGTSWTVFLSNDGHGSTI